MANEEVIVIWSILPRAQDPTAAHQNHSISLVIVVQYIPRLLVIFPLNARIIKNTGVVAKNALSGAVYNLGIYMLASHVLGAIWYLMAFERYYTCWLKQCKLERSKRVNPCVIRFLDCQYTYEVDRQMWANTTQVFDKCTSKPDNFDFGMFADVYKDEVTSTSFYDKFFYCLWWGLRNLSSYGQNLETSTSTVETLFSSLICLAGLVFFSLLIGNMQSYLQSITTRLEEWRVKRKDTEEWMRHRQLPPELQERVRRFVQYQWLATRGVDEEEILSALPLDLRRQIQRHLCLAIVRRVPFFSQMDDQLLDAICERLVPSLNTKDTYIVREGDPVNDMLFIIRGELESSTTNGGRSGFYNSIILKPGDFCGEELLTWALMPTSSMNLPSSTRTAKAITEVEAFSLRAQDLKFVANQFRRLHSKKLQHAFRYYSQQWRTWGACFIQTAWRRLKRRRLAEDLYRDEESMYYYDDHDVPVEQQETMRLLNYNDNAIIGGQEDPHGNIGDTNVFGATILASKFAANTRRGAAEKIGIDPVTVGLQMPKKLLKPDDPDFSAVAEDDEEEDPKDI
ncbi:hypothetical protein Leryth_027150 [Lithospermum erythrorhizon]|nr:hypothetical protein Leryth_027150 [Lithospermum erythrorhizon]